MDFKLVLNLDPASLTLFPLATVPVTHMHTSNLILFDKSYSDMIFIFELDRPLLTLFLIATVPVTHM